MIGRFGSRTVIDHERRFGAKIALPESGSQHIDVVQGRRNHDRPEAPHVQLLPGGGNSGVVDLNEVRGGSGSQKCGRRQIVKIAKPDSIHCMRRIA